MERKNKSSVKSKTVKPKTVKPKKLGCYNNKVYITDKEISECIIKSKKRNFYGKSPLNLLF